MTFLGREGSTLETQSQVLLLRDMQQRPSGKALLSGVRSFCLFVLKVCNSRGLRTLQKSFGGCESAGGSELGCGVAAGFWFLLSSGNRRGFWCRWSVEGRKTPGFGRSLEFHVRLRGLSPRGLCEAMACRELV